ncbi:hypothetical protein KTD31_02905 [Burkholderia multivorans]|uniref:hypothetical protein n=1 Tax=Burkholderia multivorans TaxID=87883 RepID=UPI001C22D1FC|nr:hypothetical protein [Burkholderia multivorans]MBU9200301.1 hypothetical protein [Burkholderia multivorans]MDN8078573.1 hypothetical protein [Burkholderia multivorans]
MKTPFRFIGRVVLAGIAAVASAACTALGFAILVVSYTQNYVFDIGEQQVESATLFVVSLVLAAAAVKAILRNRRVPAIA